MTPHADLVELSDKEFRDAYVDEHVRATIAYQLRSIRRKRGWSQKKLAAILEKPQSVVSRLENVTYGKLSIQTLIGIAQKLDIALIVKFADYKEFLAAYADVSDTALAVEEYNQTFKEVLPQRVEVPVSQDSMYALAGEPAYVCTGIVNMPGAIVMHGTILAPLSIIQTSVQPPRITASTPAVASV